MMVGPSGSGKSTAWRVLLMALERLEGVEGVAHVIDPKVCVYLLCTYIHVSVSGMLLLFRLYLKKICMEYWTPTLENGLMACSHTY